VQWQRCDVAGGSCTTVGTGAKYTIQAADGGYTLRVVVTVKNSLGSTTTASALTLPVGVAALPAPPANTAPPTISGTPQDGQTLSATTGTWSGSPSSYGYQWQRCDSSGAACSSVAGATTATYALTSADVGATMRVVVTATNVAGSASASSPASAVVAPAPAPATRTLTFSGSLNAKNPTRAFSVTVGAGLADARLAFSKCSSLNLGLSTGAGASGPSVVTLDTQLAAGTYTYSVSGGRCSFTLTVAAPTP
jgi:hypothetical protein